MSHLKKQSDDSFAEYERQKLTMTEDQSELLFLKCLAENEKDGGRKFDIGRDFCGFWREIHAKGYAEKLTARRIAGYVAPLWVYEIQTEYDLLHTCAQNYDDAKRDLFQNDVAAIRFFERNFPDIVPPVNISVKLPGGTSYNLKGVKPTMGAIKAGIRGLQGGKFKIAEFELLDT